MTNDSRDSHRKCDSESASHGSRYHVWRGNLIRTTRRWVHLKNGETILVNDEHVCDAAQEKIHGPGAPSRDGSRLRRESESSFFKFLDYGKLGLPSPKAASYASEEDGEDSKSECPGTPPRQPQSQSVV